MLLNQLAILRHFRDATVAHPVGCTVIREADIDMLIVCNLVKLVGDIVADEV